MRLIGKDYLGAACRLSNDGATVSAYAAQGVHFDGATSLRHGSAWTGASNNASLLFSFWFRQGGTDGADQWLVAGVADLFIQRNGSNKLRIVTENDSFEVAYEVTSTASFTAGGGWHHVMGSGNGTAATFYVDGSSEATPFKANNTMEWDEAGNRYVSNEFVPWTGDIADLYINLGAYLDLTDAGNRAKFISGGNPVDLGSDGSTPTGSAPTLFLHGPVSGWETNDGAGGGMTVIAGSLSAASSNPP